MAHETDQSRGQTAEGRRVSAAPVLKPEATIGILGGGQLGRMLALAAARLGFRCHGYSPEADSCAFDVMQHSTCAPYDDYAALARFADAVDVITYEFENIPAETAAFLAARRPVLPDPSALEKTQDRLVEKNFVKDLGIATAPFALVETPNDLLDAMATIGSPAVLKTRRLGYDGKGQRMIGPDDNPIAAWAALHNVSCILEGFVPFEREISVVAARSRDGQVECFDVAENEHSNHILKTSRVPAPISDDYVVEARRITEKIANALDYIGVLTVEMFVVGQGSGPAVLVNEIAPRVHNSGHWSIDGCTVSQFEQHIRAVAGWTLGKPVRLGQAEMTNLIGSEVNDYTQWLGQPGVALHLYGKGEPRPGRKMGHITRVTPPGDKA
jgi:5-(carboxyamino)imidazole ribonucleotide synthase